MWKFKVTTDQHTIDLIAVVQGNKMVFKGGPFGEHSVEGGDIQRAWKHWQGYKDAAIRKAA